MELNVSLSLLISLGGILVSTASAFAIVKTKVTTLEEGFDMIKKIVETNKEDLSRYREDEKVRIALLESNQEAHAKELAEIKSDIKTTMVNVQEIKEAILTLKKGEK
jgi:hypothetical protein